MAPAAVIARAAAAPRPSAARVSAAAPAAYIEPELGQAHEDAIRLGSP